MLVASILKQVFSNRNVLAISTTNMLYNVFNGLWELWWGLYLTEVLNTPIMIVGFLATIQNTSRILFQLPGGIIADRIGRKKVIVYGTCLRVIAPIFLFTARSWHWVIPGIVLNAVASLYSPAFNAIIAESLPQERRGTAFGAYRMMTTLPSVFMPFVSGYYLEVMGISRGVRLGLMMFTGAAAIAVVVRQLVLVETLDKEEDNPIDDDREEAPKGLMSMLRNQPRTIYAMLLAAAIGSFAARMTWSFLAIYAYNHVGLTTTQYGLLQSIATGISLPLFLISGMISDRYGRVPCILLARGLGPFDSLSLLLFRDYNQLMGAYAVIGLAQGLGGGRIRSGGYMGGPSWQALIADLVPSRNRGKIMGLMGTIAGIISIPASAIGGYIYEENPNLMLSLGAGLEFLALPIILFFVKEPTRETLEPSTAPT
jgi:MFS family permease